jgi:uncharacterized membrane protein YphA (DoxX/SURF4 family)
VGGFFQVIALGGGRFSIDGWLDRSAGRSPDPALQPVR